jgi:hypothetical protein
MSHELFQKNQTSHLSVIDLSDMSNPVVVATWQGQAPYALIRKDIRDTPYVYLGGGNLAVIDISNPLQPLLVRTLPIGYIFVDMIMYRAPTGRVYLYADNSQGFSMDIFEVTDPPNAVQVGQSVRGITL